MIAVFLSLFLPLLLLFGSANAATIYADNNSSGCSSPSDNDYDPATRACGSGSALVYDTVNGAKNAASGGDDIFVRGNGTVYDECVQDPPNGSSLKDTYIGGYQSERPILRPSVSGCGGRVVRLRADANVRRYIQIDNLDLDGRTANVVGVDIAESSAGVSGTSPNNIKITRNIIRSDAHSCIYSNGRNHYIAENYFDTCGATDLGHGIYSHGENEIVERNEFVGMVGYAWQYYCSTACTVPGRGTFRYNIIRNGQRGALASIAPADIYGNVCFNNSHSHGCVRVGGAATGSRIFNNVAISQSVGVSLPTSGHFVRNNILLATTPISDSGTNTKSNNITTGVASDYFVDPPTSGTDATYSFALKSTASTAIDQGTATIATGLTRAFNGSAPDIGPMERFTASNAEIGNVADNKVVLNLAMSLHTPIQITDSTGWSTTCGTISSVAVTGDAQLTFTLAGNYGGGGDCAISYTETSGNATDSLLAGNSLNQRMSGLSSFVVADNTGGGGGTHVFTQSHFRFHHAIGTEASPVVIAAEDTSVTLPRGAAFRLRTKITCTTADCPAVNLKLRYSKNSGAYTEIPDSAGADNISMHGAAGDADIPSEGTATATELLSSDQSTNVAAIIVRTNSAIPNWDCSQDCEGEFEHIIKITTSASVGDTYDFRLYDQDGTALDAYTVTPRLTVGEYIGGKWMQLGAAVPCIEIETQGGLVPRIDRRTTDRSKNVWIEGPKSMEVFVDGVKQ